MLAFKRILKISLALILLLALLFLSVKYYSVIFSKTVVGEIMAIEKLEMPVSLLLRSQSQINPQVFSFAVAIKDAKSGEIFTSSAEDRQWAVVGKGQCAEAIYLPYPPWDLEKKGTYYGARLIRLFECQR